YTMARLSDAHRTGASDTIATARAAVLEERIGVVSSEVRARLAQMPRAAFRRLHLGRDDADHDEHGAIHHPDPDTDATIVESGSASHTEPVPDDRETAEYPAITEDLLAAFQDEDLD